VVTGRAAALLAACGLLVLGRAPAGLAAEWNAIVPGESTMDAVRARFGGPTQTTTGTLDGYPTAQWVYEGPRAPVGMKRVVVDFGLLTPGGYRGEVVRALRLEPKPGVFDRASVLAGWGLPTAVAPPDQPPAFFYGSGLVVVFDAKGWAVEAMVFTPPQPAPRPPGERVP
jgi:hypothetical protein